MCLRPAGLLVSEVGVRAGHCEENEIRNISLIGLN